MSKKKAAKKGSFGEVSLSVSKKYLVPDSRRRMFYIGGVAILLFLLAASFNFNKQNASFASKGLLSSKHAFLENDCQSCHEAFSPVTNKACSVCHEKQGDERGVYTYKAHYLYQSNDNSRPLEKQAEPACFSCHAEHGGRESKLRSTADPYCVSCHKFKSFNDGHPQFDFAEHGQRNEESPGLKFTHIRHVKELVKKKKLTDPEEACLFCHNPQTDGKSFQVTDFDQHCAACHLPKDTATDFLPIKTKHSPGMETLESLQKSRAPGTLWAFHANKKEFEIEDGEVLKNRIVHRDPWVLENLRGLRKMLYQDAGLADLLDASPELPPYGSKEERERYNKLYRGLYHEIYMEALETLSNRSRELLSQTKGGKAQKELKKIDEALNQLSQGLKDPYVQIDGTTLTEKFQKMPLQVSTGEGKKILNLVNELSKNCQECHYINKATIARVQKDQRLLRRARFDHRAHILQSKCLDCHTEIPIEKGIVGKILDNNPRDHAEIQNIPTIESCQKCHKTDGASTHCTTCHDFHANKTHRSTLLRYLN